MIKRLLVPLDGSRLAEAALPAASLLAEKLTMSVMLLHLIEHNPPPTVHGDRHLTTEQDAQTYLSEVAGRAFAPGMKVDQHVHTVEVSNVPASIVDHAGEMQGDLIVMCTHGHTGLKNLLFGSIAQQVISLGSVPVLLIPAPDADLPTSFPCRKLLIPIDGSPAHEHGLPLAMEIARACGASLQLLMVVPTLETLSGERAGAGKLLPGTMSALLDLTERQAREYVAGQLQAMQDAGAAMEASVERGDPVDVILATAARVGADVIVLTTHGKTGTGAFWSGSVTPKVALRSKIPLLLVKAGARESQI